MKTSEIKELTTTEIVERLQVENEEPCSPEVKSCSVNPLDNPMKIKLAKKTLLVLKRIFAKEN